MDNQEKIREEAWLLHSQNRLNEAEVRYKRLISIDPRDCDIANLGAIMRKEGRLNEAMKLYSQWEALQEKSSELSLNAINCAIEAGEYQIAEKWTNNGIKAGNNKHIEVNRVKLLRYLNREEEAEEKQKELLLRYSEDVDLRLEIGQSYYNCGDKKSALNIFNDAIKLDSSNKRAQANIITIKGELGEYEEMDSIIERMNEIDKNNNLIKSSIAYINMRRERMVEAENTFRELCEDEPEQPLHWLNRSACLKSLKRTNMAMRVAMKGYSIHPAFSELRRALGQFNAELGKIKQAQVLLKESVKDKVKVSDQHMFNLQFLGEGYGIIESEELEELAKIWESRKLKEEGIRNLTLDRIKEVRNKIKIGYLSTDFCDHPVGRFMLPILKNHDKRKYDIIALSCKSTQDKINAKIRQVCTKWVDLDHKSDIDAARLISDLGIDVLVELNGYTSGSRPGILVYRPATIQLSYLGYFAPTYLSCIDGWIGDEILFRKLNKTQTKAHNLLLIKNGYMTLQEGRIQTPKREKYEKIRFGSFNHSRKLSRESVELICEVMSKATDAELILKSISFVECEEIDRIRKLFEQEGLEPERLITLPWVEGRENHIKYYNKIDIALDLFPYGGATTTCEALIMGIPVITLHSDGMVGGLSASILKTAGLDKYIANTKNEYVLKAIKEYSMGKRNDAERRRLRDQVLESNLNKPNRVARELERIYKSLVI